MRTTIQLDEDLLREVKTEAARKGITLKALVESALREKLARQKPEEREPVRLLTVPGRPLAGVDLSNNAALLDLMEEGLDVAQRR